MRGLDPQRKGAFMDGVGPAVLGEQVKGRRTTEAGIGDSAARHCVGKFVGDGTVFRERGLTSICKDR